jgi:WD domain, G-beta repeat
MVLSLDFSPDGTTFVSGSFDRTLRVWRVPPAAPAQALWAKITHNMTHEQWRDWVSPDIDYITVCPGLPESTYAAEP